MEAVVEYAESILYECGFIEPHLRVSSVKIMPFVILLLQRPGAT